MTTSYIVLLLLKEGYNRYVVIKLFLFILSNGNPKEGSLHSISSKTSKQDNLVPYPFHQKPAAQLTPPVVPNGHIIQISFPQLSNY